MLTELCSAHCLLPCPVNLNRSVGGRLMEVVEVSMAKTTQLDSHCYLLLSPAPIFSFFFSPLCMYVCVSLCVCVLPAGLKKSTSNLDLPKPVSRRKKKLPRCSAPKGQHNVTFDLFLPAHKKNQNNNKKNLLKSHGIFKMASADNGWHFRSATFHKRLWTWKGIDVTKGDGWFQVTTQNKLHYL